MRLNILLVCLLLLISGCSLVPPEQTPIPEEHLLTELSSQQLFAVHPDGDLIAYVNDGLGLLRLSDGYRQRLLFDSPTAMLWSADGETLVVAQREGEKTRLVKLTSNQEYRAQTLIDEKICDFAWLADDRLLALAQTVDRVNGQTQVQTFLLIWDGGRDVERQPLYRFSYLDPYPEGSIWMEPVVQRFDLSPLKDELIYSRYLDSPYPGGKVEQVLRNLHTGKERVLQVGSNSQLDALYSADAEHVILPGEGSVALLNIGTGQVGQRWLGKGEHLGKAQHRNLYLIDGRLFADDTLLMEFPADVTGQFSADASRLFIASDQKLYLFEGYPVPDERRYSATEKVKLQRIRQQRSRDEIDNRTYLKLRNNILHP